MPLNPQQEQELVGIVQRMETAGESEGSIRAVVAEYDRQSGDQFADVKGGASTTVPQNATDITEQDLAFERNQQNPPQRGAVSRFMEPIVGAAKGIPKFVGDLADANLSAMTGDPSKAIEFGKGLIEPHARQLMKAKEALGQGRYSEAAGHGAAGLLPVFGPPAADIGEATGEGNFAGALGQATVLAGPKALSGIGSAAKSALTSRAAAQALEAIGGGKGSLKLSETLAKQPSLIEGLGVGKRTTLLDRASAQRETAGSAVRALQSDTTPVSAQPAINDVLAKANEQTIHIPVRTQEPSITLYRGIQQDFASNPRKHGWFTDNEKVAREYSGEHGQVHSITLPISEAQKYFHGKWNDSPGSPLGQVNTFNVPEGAVNGELIERSGNAPLRNALRTETNLPAELEQGYAGQIPAGELFKLRAQIGARARSAYDRTPGSPPPVTSEAPAAMRDAISKTLHDQVPGSANIDAAYHNWNSITTRLKKAVDADINAKNSTSFGDYMKGRLASAAVGAAAGGAVGNIPGAAAGGLAGVILAKSPFWHSLKATTYAKLARYINAGDYPAAYTVLTAEAENYAVGSKANSNFKAQEILNQQGQGVLTP